MNGLLIWSSKFQNMPGFISQMMHGEDKNAVEILHSTDTE